MIKRLLIIFFLLPSFFAAGQNGYYKYLFHGKSIQYYNAISNGVSIPNGHYLIEAYGFRNTVNYYQTRYDSLGNEKNSTSTFYNSPTSYYLNNYQPVTIKSNLGCLSTLHEKYSDTTIIKTIHFDENLNPVFTLDNFKMLNGSYGKNFGFLTEVEKSGKKIINLKDSGKISFEIFKDSLPTLNKDTSGFYRFEKYFCYDKFGFLAQYNFMDSIKILKLDSNGDLVSSISKKIAGLKNIGFQNNVFFTIEEDSTVIVKFRDKNLNIISTYSPFSGFPISYSNSIYNDSLITLVLINNINGNIYGTKNPPEIHVINWKGKFINKRYLRYNGGFMNIIPRNAIAPKIIGIDYTDNFGYNMILNQADGTLDHQFGILKINKNLVCDDTVFVPGYRIYMNLYDSILTPMQYPPNNLIEEKLPKGNIWPNPFSNKLHFDDIYLNQRVQLINTEGKVLINQNIENNSLDISNLKPGIYFIKVKNQLFKVIKI